MGENEVLEQRMTDLARRIERLEDDTWQKEMSTKIEKIGEAVANLNGRIAGYLMAGTLLGAVVSMLAQYVLKK